MKKRPISVVVIAALYIAVGVIGFAFHLREFRSQGGFYDTLLIELTELIALVSGLFMLRGQNWARWIAVAWIASHVVLSAFEAYRGFVVHCIFCGLIAWALFSPPASRYFRKARSGEAV